MTATPSPKAGKAVKKKLTLSIEEEVIELGKAFAKTQGVSLSKLFEQFILDHLPPERKPISVIEPDPDILALMGKPATPPKHKTNREYYDEYYEDRRARYIKNSKIEEE